MSYILDALRKSEHQRRLGTPPDLGTADSATASRPFATRKRIGLVLALLVLVLLIAGLFWTERFNRSGWTGGEGAGVETSPEPESMVPPVDEPEQPEQSPADDEPSDGTERRRRTVVDRRDPSREAPVRSESRPAPAEPGAVPTPPPVVPEGERERLVESAEEAQRLIAAEQDAAASRRAVEPDAGRASDPEPDQVVPDEADEPVAELWQPDRLEYLEVWELPLDVRRELPELDLSIHVFSADRDQRFVLINGERRREGDRLGSGAQLIEISRSGAIVEFRDYRFLLAP